MSDLQQEAVRMISELSDENNKMQAFWRLDAARAEIRQYLPEDFDPEKELEEARAARYGSAD